jgi:hypothetical protein
MKRTSFAAACLLVAVLPAAAHAQATRTWVSGVGDDANPCSRTAPCKTFAGAISKTAAGGEISVLDPGGFGVVTITKSITINGDGTLAGILAAGTNGIIVNAAATDRVVLRNLSINGIGTGLNGIRYLAGKHLLVDHCVIQGFTTRGIDASLGANPGRLEVQDTTITNGGTTNSSTGIFMSTSSASFVLGVFNNVRLVNLNNGIDVGQNGRASISNSTISGNTSNGVLASHGSAVINVSNSQIAFNELVGVNASISGALIRVSNNDIQNNSTGISIAGGATVQSALNNRVVGNGASAAPNGAAFPIQ